MNIEEAKQISNLIEQREDLEKVIKLLSVKSRKFGFIINSQKIKGIGVECMDNHFISAFPFKNQNNIGDRMLKFYILELQEIDNKIKQIQC